MSLLAYCTLEADAQVEIPTLGVQSEPIVSHQEAKLQCLVSRFSSPTVAGQTSLRESALTFNRVLQALLEQAAIIPFRFLTIVADAQEISGYLREHEEALCSDLVRFRTMVQMEILIQLQTSAGARQLQSGKNYLRAKQAQFERIEKVLSDLRHTLAPYTKEWRLRESVDRARGYALVNRNAINDFRQAAKAIVLPDGVAVRITGPWPVSEFLASYEGVHE